MDLLKKIIENAVKLQNHIVLPEGKEIRTLKATEQILKEKIARITLLGNQSEIESIASKEGLNISGARIIDPATDSSRKKYAEMMVELRRNKGLTIEKAYELTHPDGKTILVGVPKKGDNVSIYTLPIHFNKILKGSHGGSCIPHIDIPRYIRLIQAGKMTLNGLITHEFSLEKINDAIKLMMSGEAGRIVIAMN